MRRKLLAILLALSLVAGLTAALSLTGFATEATPGIGTAPVATYPATEATWSPIAVGNYTNFKTADGDGVTFVDFNNCQGSLDFTVNAPTAGEYYVSVGFSTKNSRSFGLSVGETDYGTFAVTENGSWYAVNSYYTVKVVLADGNNTVKVYHPGGTAAIPCISGLTVASASEWLTAADHPTLTGAAAAKTEMPFAFDQTVFDVGNAAGTVTWNITVPASGTYKATFPYASGGSSAPISLLVAEETVMTTGNRVTSGGYNVGMKFLTSEEFYLNAGENVPVTLSWAGGAYLSGVRLELVESDPNGTRFESKDLTVSYSPTTQAGTVYSVDILWENEDFNFDYAAGNQGDWNPAEHEFGAVTGDGWTDRDLKVTVVNHSNAAVKTSMSLVDADGEDGVSVTSDKEEVTLLTAENTAVEDAPSTVYTLTVSGTPTKSSAKIATATVSLAAAE